jgi:uncharacterized protein YqfA (UPF0365 family)
MSAGEVMLWINAAAALVIAGLLTNLHLRCKRISSRDADAVHGPGRR